jgi:hypothetical protein
MKLVMVTSLGLFDAQRLHIQAETARDGDTVDVDPKVGETLLRRGWAVPAKEAPKEAPRPVDFTSAPKSGRPNA